MAVTNSIAERMGKQTFSNFITGATIKQKVTSMIGDKDGPRFISSLISAVTANPILAECDFSSILSAAMLGEGLKLSPSPQLGQFYMVPFNDKKRGCKVAQFQLGYHGYIQLAIRSGYYKKLNVLAIKQGELIKFDPLNEEIQVKIIEDEAEREQAEAIGYYAMFEYQNGFRKAIYWSKAKMEAHADKYSAAFSLDSYRKIQDGKIKQDDMWKYSSFWYKDFDGMALKTMIRQLISKWGIMSIDMQTAIDADIEVVSDSGKDIQVDAVDDFFSAPIRRYHRRNEGGINADKNIL